LHERLAVDPRRELESDRGAVQARARDSFFADRRAPAGALRVCRGTSCRLAGATASNRALEPRAASRPIYCAGHCDRSPVALRADGAAIALRELGSSGAPVELPSLPAIRSLGRAAIVTERVVRGEHHALAAARAAGAWSGLERALRGEPEAVLRALEASGERGRGGGAFPTGTKWRWAAQARGPERFAIANGDEGDPGSFVDRVLLEADPHAVLEGLALCGFAIGAGQGIVYVRSEYPRAAARVTAAIDQARAAGLLGPRILGSDFDFDVRVALGEGSYVCGEETALLNALEGRRGEVRLRPPYPTERGLFGAPTTVNNVETLVNAAWIVRSGPAAYRALGTRASRGTKALSLNAGFAQPGLVEVEFGASLAQVIAAASGGVRLAAVALGGPMGSVLRPDEWDVPICTDEMSARGISLGHGGLVALREGTDFAAVARDWLAFMADESCGKCTPCRVGSRQAVGLAERGERERLLELLEVVADTSLCPFGQSIPGPVRKLLELAR
jgi:NADH:ubiquinone oxidoreductase subunit F (NADH-binding)